MFDLRRLYLSLDVASQERFCAAAETTDNYVRVHLLYATRVPRKRLMESLVKACQQVDPAITTEQVVMFFHRADQGGPAGPPPVAAAEVAP